MAFKELGAPALLAILIAAPSAAWSQPDHPTFAPKTTLTITLDGTLGPIISGSDPAGLDGQSATVTVTAAESLSPYRTGTHSASYHIPAGDITVTVNGTQYQSESRSSLNVKLGAKADLLTLKAKLNIDGFTVQVSDASALASGSWSKTVLQHPTPFSPSPQTLVEPASNFTYSVLGETTELGVSGTAANGDSAGPN